jgi:hypothetical protein
MENQDKLYEQFQQASQKAEGKDFPGMDKVWSRVEDKMDRKVLKKQNKLWKKIAIAASFLLLFTLGYQAFKEEEVIVTPENSIVDGAIETNPTDAPIMEVEEKTATPTIINPKQAEKIIHDKIKPQESVAVMENRDTEPVASSANDAIVATAPAREENESRNAGYIQTRKFNAKSVQNNLAVKEKFDSTTEEQTAKKQDPLFVVDGKAITKSNKESEALLKSKASTDDIESFEVLAEPLYIINGVEYSEEELFGTNPTSPYFPLNKQEIISTTVLQGERATNLYGEKGKKGVVVIVTKNGKPLKK